MHDGGHVVMFTAQNGQRTHRLDCAGEFKEADARLIAAGEEPKVRVYMAMGTEDPLLKHARRARGFFEGFPGDAFDFTYEEAPGTHSWPFWEEHLQRFLNWL